MRKCKVFAGGAEDGLFIPFFLTMHRSFGQPESVRPDFYCHFPFRSSRDGGNNPTASFDLNALLIGKDAEKPIVPW
jgi:hypothetical protein